MSGVVVVLACAFCVGVYGLYEAGEVRSGYQASPRPSVSWPDCAVPDRAPGGELLATGARG